VSDNLKTILYAAAMTLIVALSLASMTSILRPIQKVEEDRDKKVSILSAVEFNENMDADKEYEIRIQEVVVDATGEVIEGKNAFDINLYKEGKKRVQDRLYPIYIYTADTEKKTYILPMNGMGLWDQIGGFIALKEDFNSINGVTFNHVGETPGLGAEIAENWFQEQFEDKKLKDANGNYQFDVKKGTGNQLDEYSVDGITGSTITTDGLEAMIEEDLRAYDAYFKNLTNQQLIESGSGNSVAFGSGIMQAAKDFFKLGNKRLENQINFQGRSSIVTDESTNQIKTLVAFLKTNPTKRVKILVNDRKDESLSIRKAESIYAYALQQGANEGQLSFTGIKDRKSGDRVEFELLN